MKRTKDADGNTDDNDIVTNCFTPTKDSLYYDAINEPPYKKAA